jgi:glycosyltransferase involved in cell wall biosynthesis
MNNPKISVCIPVYNGSDFIEEAIKSVLSQNFDDYELLIIDNKSTDNTVDIINNFKSPKIRLIQNTENIGLIPNWNKALENARGKYIKILPADDLIYQGCLLKQSEILDNDVNEEIAMVCARRNIIDNKGKILFNRGFTKKEQIFSGIQAINKNIRSGGNIIGEGGAIMFRKSIIAKTGVFNSSIFYVLDLDLWFKILLHGNLYALPLVLSAFRVSGNSASVHVVNKQHQDNSNFIKKIYADKTYKLSFYSYIIGIIKSYILTQAKKILYKYVLK